MTPRTNQIGNKTLWTGLTVLILAAGLLAACTGGAAPVAATQPAGGGAGVTQAATTAATLAGVLPTAPAQAAEMPAATESAVVVEVTPPAGATAQANPPPAPAATAAQSPAAGGTARQAVINAMHALAQAGPYRVNSNITTGDKTIQSTAEVILPDRFHITGIGQETLIVGSQTWMKQNDAWVVFPIDVGSMVSGMLGPLTAEAEQGISGVTLLGPDTVNGAPALVYQYQSNVDLQGTPVTSQVKLWLDTARGLPVKQEIVGEYGGVKSTTVQDITYDPSIKIEAP